jgi:hypothetical protein
MSHHLDTAEARADPRLDISDVYCFRGSKGTVLVIDLDPLSGSRGFHPEAMYEFKVDLDDDAIEDVTLRATFTPLDEQGRQHVTLRLLTGRAARDRDAGGRVIATGRTEQVITGAGGVTLFAGRRGEPFYIEPRVITEIRRAMGTGTAVDLSSFDPATAQNLFAQSNVTALVVEIPRTLTPTGTIGFWGTSVLATDAGGWRQINRAAGPLINTIWDFTKGGTVDIDYNDVEPEHGKAVFGPQVVEQTAAVVRAMGTHPDPDAFARCVRDTLFPDVLRYRIGTAASYGPRVQNGKGLIESAPESIFELVLNTHVEMGLDAGDATGTLLTRFPYLSAPLDDAPTTARRASPADTALTGLQP